MILRDDEIQELVEMSGEYPRTAIIKAIGEATLKTAKRCKEIAQQRYLAESQAVEIDEKISAEFGV
jgi:hypothetical protein